MKILKRERILVAGILLDSKRKSFVQIIKDLNKIKPGKNYLNFKNYFKSLMYKKHAGDLDNYFNGEIMRKIISTFKLHPILTNKIKFAHLMMENNMPIAYYIGCIKAGTLISKNNEKYDLREKDEVISIINQWLKEFKTIFIKPIDTLGGAGILKFQLNDKIDINKINFNKDYIVEKGLIQHPDLDKINPNCINSLRVISVRVNEDIYIPNYYLRMGIGSSFIDNASAGGIFVNYDFKNNQLAEIAHAYAVSGGKSYTVHPDTKYSFKDKKLPYPEKIEALVKRAAHLFPDIAIIGWDIAYTDDGPVIIEGNSNPDMEAPQITSKGLNRNMFYKEYL